MKKFLFKVSLFTFLLALVNVYSFWIVEEYYHSGSGYSEVDLSYDHYILTDSHANPLKGYTEQYDIYNFAYGSDSYYDMKRKMTYIIENAEVKTIFITVGNLAVSKRRDISNNTDRSVEFSNVSDYSSYSAYFKDKYISRYITLLNPKVRSLIRIYTQNTLTDFIRSEEEEKSHQNEKSNNDTNSVNTLENSGWAGYSKETRWNRSLNRFKKQFSYDEPSPNLIRELKSIVSFAKQNNIRLIGISYPISNEFLKLRKINDINYSGAPILEEAGFEVYDFSDYYTDKQYYFADPHHLNKIGGEAFAKEFDKILMAN